MGTIGYATAICNTPDENIFCGGVCIPGWVYARVHGMNYDTVIDHFGSAYQLARALGVRPAAIYHWKGKVPQGRVKEIQRLMKRPWVPKGEIRPQLRARGPLDRSGATTAPRQG